MQRQPSPLFLLARKSFQNSIRWFKISNVLKHDLLYDMACGLSKNSSQVEDVLEAAMQEDKDFNDASLRMQIGMSLADTYIYALNICAVLNMDPELLIQQRTAQNEKEFITKRSIENRKSDG